MMKKLFLTLILAFGTNLAHAAYNYTWYTDGTCAETTPDGYKVMRVSKSYCEQSIGYSFAWYTDGTCVVRF